MRQPQIPLQRLHALWIACYIGAGLLGLRLLHVQVLRNVYYTELAERNRTQIIYQAAPRGRIYDARGEVIATNRPAFSLIYLPGQEHPRVAELAEALSQGLRLPKEDLLKKLQEAVRERSAIHLAENLPLKTMLQLSEIKTIYPGVDLIVEARRSYPFGAFAGHLLGYMGRMDKRSWRKFKGGGYRIDSWVGKSGLEKIFERELKGTDGEIRMEVDAQGHLKRVLEQLPWRPGSNLHLALDARLQREAEEGLRASPSKTGAAVVLDPRTGDVLALASLPDFDPNLFLLPLGEEPQQALADLPEFNRAISGTYAPGSTFKMVVGAALFNEGRARPSERTFCPGFYWLGNRPFRCWEKKGHQFQDWIGGIAHSCDVYFYHMGLRSGGELIEKYEKLFRLGEPTGVILAGENAGKRFGPESRRLRRRAWYDGDTLNLSIGQGELLVTPIQMAVVVAALANRGTLWRPHLVRRLEYADGRPPFEQKPETLGRIELSGETWELLDRGLKAVVEQGTGAGVRVRGLAVAGKTGTAQNPLGEDHAWFVAYAGREGEAPSLALSVLVQHGGHGASAAGPIARRILSAAFDLAKAAPPQAVSEDE